MLKKRPTTFRFKIMPKWRIFATSGHTCCTLGRVTRTLKGSNKDKGKKLLLWSQDCILKDISRILGIMIGCSIFFLKSGWAIPGLFFDLFCLFNTVDSKQMFNKDFADDWIRSADLWYWKQPFYQLSHNHFPTTVQYLTSIKSN